MSIIKGYIGSYADNEGIYKFDFDTATGKIYDLTLLHRGNQMKSIVCERGSLLSTIASEDEAGIVLLDINQPKVYVCDSEFPEAITSCFIYRNVNTLYTANYHEGSFCVYDVSHGSLKLAKRVIVADGAKCHQVFVYDHYLFVVCLGLDKIKIYDINLDYEYIKDIEFPKDSGPRHAVIDENSSYMYVITENSNEVFVFEIKAHLTFYCAQFIKTVPTGTKETNTSAAICLAKNGKFLYTTSRGSNIITTFSIIKGCLKRISFVESGGDHPRDMILDPTGNYLIVSNRYSNNIVVYRIGRQGEIVEQCDDKKLKEPAAVAFKNK